MLDRAFFVRGDDGNEYGPVFLPELREWVKENRAGLGTMVRLEDPDSPWQAWQEFPELVVLLAEGNSSSALSEVILASFISRLAASILDMMLCIVLYVPLLISYLVLSPDSLKEYADFEVHEMILITQGNEIPADIKVPQVIYNLSFIMTGVWIVYLTSFLYAHGKTPAKAIFGIRVVNELGQSPTLFQSAIRSMCFVFTFSMFFSLFAYGGIFLFLIPFIFGGNRRALHDLVSGTMVIKAPKSN